MAEHLTLPEIVARLEKLVAESRCLEMAITGACSFEDDERDALELLSGSLAKNVKALHCELNDQHMAEWVAQNHAEKETKS